MTVETALALAQTLAPKSPGHLITAVDWNDLVSVLVDYGQALQGLPARMAAAEAAIALLDGRVTAFEPLAARLQALETQTAPLLQNYRLQVRTLAENHLVGQVATLEFTVTALDGSALPAPMPWLDVFTSWGRLRAAPGFTVRDNAEENALSIQFNNAGVAQVQLRSQFTRGLALTEELSFANTLQLQAGSTGRTVMQVLQTSKPVPPALREVLMAFEAGEPMLDWRQGGWGDVGTAARAVRQAVFVDELGAPAELVHDANDLDAVHVVAINRLGAPLAGGRLLAAEEGVSRIGRLAVLPPLRCTGIGRRLLDGLVDASKARGDREVRVDALVSAISFYERAGFVPRGEAFEHAGVAHQAMWLKLAR